MGAWKKAGHTQKEREGKSNLHSFEAGGNGKKTHANKQVRYDNTIRSYVNIAPGVAPRRPKKPTDAALNVTVWTREK